MRLRRFLFLVAAAVGTAAVVVCGPAPSTAAATRPRTEPFAGPAAVVAAVPDGVPRYLGPGLNDWAALAAGWPDRPVLERRVPRRTLALALDPAHGTAWAATKFSVLHRSLSGACPERSRRVEGWRELPLTGMNPYATFTALGRGKTRLYAGTACYGVWAWDGRTWAQLARGLPGEQPPPRRSFFETVTAIAERADGTLFAGLHFGGGVWALAPGAAAWTNVPLPRPVFRVAGLAPLAAGLAVHDGTDWILPAGGATPPERALLDAAAAGAARARSSLAAADGSSSVAIALEPPIVKTARHPQVKGRRGLYFSAWRAKPAVLAPYVALMKKQGMDTLVVDVKDDFGRVLYEGGVPMAKAAGAYSRALDLPGLVKFCRTNGVYLVARLVTFKDPVLAAYKGGIYAAKDSVTGGLWFPGSKESWVDPFNTAVHEYNVAIAKEIMALGVDEIQFDYIRFPTDGPLWRAVYPSKPAGAWKIDALENFLARARRDVPGPISTDVYGSKGWYALGNWMGQDISLFARYVDALSAMHYPSHFDWDWRIERGRDKQAYDILYHGTVRPRALTQGQVELRPYLQAFTYRAYGWGPGYLEEQVRGVKDAGGTGYLFWDAASYYGILSGAKLDMFR